MTTALQRQLIQLQYLRIIDNKLTFGPHIAQPEVKLSRSVGILSKRKYFLPSSLGYICKTHFMHFFIHIYYMDLSHGSIHIKLIPTKYYN